MNAQLECIEPCGLSKESIFKVAEFAAKRVGYTRSKSNFDFIKSIGGKIRQIGTHDWLEDPKLLHVSNNGFEIYIPEHTGPLTDRAVVGQALGHYIIHSKMGRDKIKISRRYNNISDRFEWEAAWFSMAFLINKTEFMKWVRISKKDCSALAGLFMVPQELIRLRLASLNISKHGVPC